MSRLTEAMERQASLDKLDNKEFVKECNRANIATISELGHIHHKLIDLMMDNPKDSSAKLAEKLGLTKAYVDRIRRTPVFIIEYESAVAAVHREFRTRLVSHVAKATTDALLGLSSILTSSEESAGDKIRAAKLLTEGDAFGLFATGGKESASPRLNVNINNTQQEAPASKLGLTADMLKESNARRLEKYSTKEVVNGEISEAE